MKIQELNPDELPKPLSEWPHLLKRRIGAPQMASGIVIYFDFDWVEQFKHNRTSIRNGKALCRHLRRVCPEEKQPALLLTKRDDKECPETISCEEEHIVVLKLDDWRNLKPDAGKTLFGDRIKIDLFNVHSLDFTPEALAELTSAQPNTKAIGVIAQTDATRRLQPSEVLITPALVKRWCDGDPKRRSDLDAALDGSAAAELSDADSADSVRSDSQESAEGDRSTPLVADEEVIRTLEALDEISADLLEALKTLLARETNGNSRVDLIKSLAQCDTSDSSNAAELIDALVSAVNDQDLDAGQLLKLLEEPSVSFVKSLALSARIEEYRATLSELRVMVELDEEPESTYQKLLEENIWLMGSEYSERLARRRVTRDENLDFMLRRTADDYFEILEIKTPNPSLLLNLDRSHHSYYQSNALAIVIGQVIRYIDRIDSDRTNIHFRDNIDPLKIRARIIIGRDNDEHQVEALRNLNGHLHRIEVLTFDQLIKIGERVISLCAEDADNTDL